jgi:hypothetical protein
MRWFSSLLMCAATGCYYYRPVPTLTPPPGAYVAVTLTDSGTDHFWRYLGPDVGTVRGRVLVADDTSYAVGVEAVELRHGTTLDWKGERVVLPRSYVVVVQGRHFSVGRSVLAGGLSVVGLVASYGAFRAIQAGGGSGGGGGPPR